MTDGLRENLTKVFMLPTPAVEWLLMVFDAIQVFDDVADGDAVERKDLNATIWNTLVGMHQNQFFIANSHHLVPLLATMILKWQASDTAERQGKADAKSFGWRAGYYDLILMTVSLIHGAGFATQNAHLVMALYGENFEDYMKEFGNA
jgi:hypothetical protein